MYNLGIRQSLRQLADESNKDNKLLLRVYKTELDYENGIYTEVSGDVISHFTYEHSINTNNYINYGDVNAGSIQFDLITKGYELNQELISLFKEFTIVKPYVLQTGNWSQWYNTTYRIKGLKFILSNYFTDELDKDFGYVLYDAVDDDYVISSVQAFNYYTDEWFELQSESVAKNIAYCYPLGKFYVTDISTKDYYRNTSITAFDALGLCDITAYSIDGVAPTIEYKDQAGLVNYFLYKNGLVEFNEETQALHSSFSQYVAYKMMSNHVIVKELPAEGSRFVTYLILENANENLYRQWIYSDTDNAWHDNGTIIIGENTSFVVYYPDNSISVRTLLSYLAQRGNIEGGLEWLKPKRTPFNVVVNRHGDLVFKNYEPVTDYCVATDHMLAQSLNGLPTEKATVGQSICTSTLTSEETGASLSVGKSGTIGSSLNLSFPTRYPTNVAAEAVSRIFELANSTVFTNGVKIFPAGTDSDTWAKGLEHTLRLHLVENAESSRGYIAYWCVIDNNNNFDWQICPISNWEMFDYLSNTFEWTGDLNLECGDIIKVKDELGKEYNFPVMSQRIDFDGGIKQKLSASGTSRSSVTLSQNSAQFSSQLEQTYPLISNAVKKVATINTNDNNSMVAFVDDGTDNVPNAIVISQYSSENDNHNWLNEGKVVRLDNNGISYSMNGFRGNFEKCLFNGVALSSLANENASVYSATVIEHAGWGQLRIYCEFKKTPSDSSFEFCTLPYINASSVDVNAVVTGSAGSVVIWTIPAKSNKLNFSQWGYNRMPVANDFYAVEILYPI